MINIYEQKSKLLHELITESGHHSNASILIPDLQRPYVWTPPQVSLLIDSLIRGWPFGTLLIWKVGKDQIAQIPNRTFWERIDRTGVSKSAQVDKYNPPGDFYMVLDGQQRVQSLLLALGGDDWGFQLEDRNWAELIHGARRRGPQGKHVHWSKASLCFDMQEFHDLQKISPVKVDFQKVLKWVITDPSPSGQSRHPKPSGYDEPLPRAWTPENQGRYVRLARLWNWAGMNPTSSYRHFAQILPKNLEDAEVAPQLRQELIEPLAELMTTLLAVKFSEVTYLQLRPFDPLSQEADVYNDAIVNIFTRLNTAGRTLTTQEITYAWLKSGWKEDLTRQQSAQKCIDDLRLELANFSLKLHSDELIGALSLMWSAVFRPNGKLLANKDLLVGEIVCPMALDLSASWEQFREAMLNVAEAIRDNDIAFRDQFSSMTSLSLLFGWSLHVVRWQSAHQDGMEAQKDDFKKQVAIILKQNLDRWLLTTQWAGRWAQAGTYTVAFVKRLHDFGSSLRGIHDRGDSLAAMGCYFTEELSGDLCTDAKAFVDGLGARRRSGVRNYKTPLWLWHRLNANRWEKSRIPLRVRGRTASRLEVDHVIAVHIWEGRKTADPSFSGDDSHLHSIGNCLLLEKSFNISKGKRTMSEFLGDIGSLGSSGARELTDALHISEEHSSPRAQSLASLEEIIKTRTSLIKAELREFIDGTRRREDA